VAELLYKAEGAAAPGADPAGETGGAPKRDDVTDAEFTEEKGGSN
jgi:hypothetical protein